MNAHRSVCLPTLLLAACGAGTTVGTPTLDYGGELLLRVGEPVAVAGANANGSDFVALPPLPAGLQVDPANGAITGTPTAVAAGQDYFVQGRVGDRVVGAQVHLAVGPALPAEVTSLEAGFAIATVAELPVHPAKLAIAPDGRAFVTELASGVVRVIAADGSLQATPFATVPVANGSHRGLLGIALSPHFADDGLVFACACDPGTTTVPVHGVLYRWRDVGDLGVEQTVLRDDLPVATLDNGGALCFDATGMLLLTVGDTEDPALAQDDGSLAGKLLRLDPSDGSAAAGNPVDGDPVVAKGLRNTFAIARDPATDLVWFADNGPTTDDELNLLQPGRNYEWGAPPDVGFGALTGTRLRLWPEVVVPTGVAFRDAADALDWPDAYDGSVYVALYGDEVVRRFERSGPLRTDLDREVDFVTFLPDANRQKPLDVQRGPDGRLWVLTFTHVYRIDRIR